MAMVKEVVVLIGGEAVDNLMIELGEIVIVDLEVEAVEKIEKTIIMNQMIQMMQMMQMMQISNRNKKTINNWQYW